MGDPLYNEHPSGWTEERIDLLKRLWLEGGSASEIARVLGGGVSRNAVIGKVTRLKLTRRKETAIRAAKAVGGRGSAGKHRGVVDAARKARASNGGGLAFKISRARKEQPEATSIVEALASMRAEDPEGQKLLRAAAWVALPDSVPKRMVDLERGECKWPIGDAPILFCGATAEGVYCTAHAGLARMR